MLIYFLQQTSQDNVSHLDKAAAARQVISQARGDHSGSLNSLGIRRSARPASTQKGGIHSTSFDPEPHADSHAQGAFDLPKLPIVPALGASDLPKPPTVTAQGQQGIKMPDTFPGKAPAWAVSTLEPYVAAVRKP